MLRQHRHQPENKRQFAVVAAAEIEAHGARIERLGLGHFGVVGAVIRTAVIAQELPGKNHVRGRHRRAIGEVRRRIEPEGDVAARIVGLDRTRQQPVKRERFVVTARHQALDHVTAEVLHRETFDDERIEAVERAEHALHQPAALRSIRIGIGKLGKIVRHRRMRRAWRWRERPPRLRVSRKRISCKQCTKAAAHNGASSALR